MDSVAVLNCHPPPQLAKPRLRLVLPLLCLVVVCAASAARPFLGDVNGDGQVNVLDVQTLANVLLGGTCGGNCDINSDGRVDILDLQRLVNIVLGLAACPS